MGCCASVPSHNDGQSQDNQEAAEDRSAQTARNAIADISASSQPGRRRMRRRPDLPLGEHYNEPVRLHVWHSKRRTWTPAQLARERREFFETRVTGRPEVWAALSSTISLMRAGDLATAQSILDAAGITIPTGDLCEGCYDEQGVLYRLPQCIVSDPENLVNTASGDATPVETGQDDDTETLSDGRLATDDASGDELIADIERRRDEKGKTSERDLIHVQARLSDCGGPDLVLSVGKNQSVGFLARKVQQEAGIETSQHVRIAYLGRMLREHESLLEQGWQTGHIINALVVSHPPLS